MNFTQLVPLLLFGVVAGQQAGGEHLRRRTFIMPPEKEESNNHEADSDIVDPDTVPTRRVYVKYLPQAKAAIQTRLAQRSLHTKMHFDFRDMNTYVLSVPEDEIDDLRSSRGILSIVDDAKRYPQHLNDVRPVSKQLQDQLDQREVVPYGVKMVQAPDLWKMGFTGQNMTVCVVDSGVDGTHVDFDPERLSGLKNDRLPWDEDTSGHGTHCAGTIAAERNNGRGVVGVAPDAKIVSVRVFGENGFAYSSGILAAARECADLGADVISMSLGGPLPNLFELFGFRTLLRERGIISVAASGNSGNGLWSFPASYFGVVSVGAVDKNKTLASFSQFNRQVDFTAPGVDVLSTLPMKNSDGRKCRICERAGYTYGSISGTSMATPHVAGAIALLKSVVPTASAEDIIKALEATAEDLGSRGKDRRFGHGLIQTMAAAEYLNEGALLKMLLSQQDFVLDDNDEEEENVSKMGGAACTVDEGHIHFHLEAMMDDFARETYWTVRRMSDNGVQLSGAGYDDNSAVTEVHCIPRDDCYVFTMYDSEGNGMCCEHGKGGYSVMIDGQPLVLNGGEFESEDSPLIFGECGSTGSTAQGSDSPAASLKSLPAY